MYAEVSPLAMSCTQQACPEGQSVASSHSIVTGCWLTLHGPDRSVVFVFGTHRASESGLVGSMQHTCVAVSHERDSSPHCTLPGVVGPAR